MGRSVPGSIDQVQRLSCVGQGDQQRVVAPDPIVGQSHPFLATAGGRHQRSIHVDTGDLLGQRRMLLPDGEAARVDRGHQRPNICRIKTTAEIPGGRGVGDARRVECSQKRGVVAPPLDILQHLPAAHDVVGDVQHMVGLVIRHVQLEQVHPLVDLPSQSRFLDQLLNHADAAAVDPMHPLGQLVALRPPSQYWTTVVGLYSLGELIFDFLLL